MTSERPCDWWVPADRRRGRPSGYRCGNPARWLWLPRRDRALCDRHAQSWMHQGQHFERLPIPDARALALRAA